MNRIWIRKNELPRTKSQEPRTRPQQLALLPIWNLVLGSWYFLLVSHTRAEACPPPSMNTTNKLPPFGHRRGKKTSMRPKRFAQRAFPRALAR
jgi:hypothetical protein